MSNMNSNFKPLESGNAHNINNVCYPVHAFVLMRYEAIADFFTEEPPLINIQLTQKSDVYTFEQVLRTRIWLSNKKTESWCIYSEEREWPETDGKRLGGLVIRHAVWDRKLDLTKVKQSPDTKNILNDWPAIELQNYYVKPEKACKLIETFRSLDTMLEGGIKLRKRKDLMPQYVWNELEVKRLFDWGSVHAVWHPFMVNEDLEEKIFDLGSQLNSFQVEKLDYVYKMDLDYSCPPEVFKAIIQGNSLTE